MEAAKGQLDVHQATFKREIANQMLYVSPRISDFLGTKGERGLWVL
jgi:hypothetical protein